MTKKYNIRVTEPKWKAGSIPSWQQRTVSIYCPFTSRRNPYADEVVYSSQQWLEHFYPNTKLRQRAIKAKMSELSAGFYPEAGLQELSTVTDYLLWIFALDDLVDESETGRNPGKDSNLLHFFKKINFLFDGGIPPENAQTSELAFYDILQRLSSFSTEDQLTAFAEANRAYFGGMIWEASNRAVGEIPNEENFKELRPIAGAIRPFFS